MNPSSILPYCVVVCFVWFFHFSSHVTCLVCTAIPVLGCPVELLAHDCLVSSPFDTGTTKSFCLVEWTRAVLSCCFCNGHFSNHLNTFVVVGSRAYPGALGEWQRPSLAVSQHTTGQALNIFFYLNFWIALIKLLWVTILLSWYNKKPPHVTLTGVPP